LSSQGDRVAMAHSVEGRFPFLDHRVVEFAASLSPSLRLRGLQEKYILKRAFSDLLPEQVLRRPKQPYRAPIARAFIGQDPPDYVTELLSEGALRDAGYFNPIAVQALLQKAKRRDGALSEREEMALVGVLSTQLLHHLFLKEAPEVQGVSIKYSVDERGIEK
ncbi:MAG: asparagine synthetase B, partial [Candidatus Hydrothermarchaeota archaeon]